MTLGTIALKAVEEAPVYERQFFPTDESGDRIGGLICSDYGDARLWLYVKDGTTRIGLGLAKREYRL